MYDIIKQIIMTHTYKDSNALDRKVKTLWLSGEITDEQCEELRAMLYEAPVKDYAVQGEIDKLWKEVRRIAQIVDNMPEPTPEPSDIPVWIQPTGAHDAYQTGDRVHYPTADDPIYESLIDGNVWSPEAYPSGWREVE